MKCLIECKCLNVWLNKNPCNNKTPPHCSLVFIPIINNIKIKASNLKQTPCEVERVPIDRSAQIHVHACDINININMCTRTGT